MEFPPGSGLPRMRTGASGAPEIPRIADSITIHQFAMNSLPDWRRRVVNGSACLDCATIVMIFGTTNDIRITTMTTPMPIITMG